MKGIKGVLFVGVMVTVGERAPAPIMGTPEDETAILQHPPGGRGPGIEMDVSTWVNLGAIRTLLETEHEKSPDFSGLMTASWTSLQYAQYLSISFADISQEQDGITSEGAPYYGCDGLDPMEWLDSSVNAVIPPPYIPDTTEYAVTIQAQAYPHAWFADCQEEPGEESLETEAMLGTLSLETETEEDLDNPWDENWVWACYKHYLETICFSPENDPKDSSCEDLFEEDAAGTGSPSVTLPGAGLPTTLRLIYNSRYGTKGEVVSANDPERPKRHIRRYDLTGSLGLGWMHSFDLVIRRTRTVYIDSSHYYWWDVLENDGTGREVGFGHWVTPDESWDHIPSERWESCTFSNGQYVLVTKGETVYTFEEHNDPSDPLEATIEPVKRYEIASIEEFSSPTRKSLKRETFF